MKIFPASTNFSFTAIVILTILGMVTLPVEGEDLMCWACTGNAAPLCDPGDNLKDGHLKKGISEPCPHPDEIDRVTKIFNITSEDEDELEESVTKEKEKWGCYIKELTVLSTGRVEVYKGCIRYYGAFFKNRLADVFDGRYLALDANTLQECGSYADGVGQRTGKSEHFTESNICLCNNTDNCNDKTFTHAFGGGDKSITIGHGDIEYKLKMKKSKASIPKIGYIAVAVTSFLPIFTSFVIKYFNFILNAHSKFIF